jgi:hypothetical protein
MTREQKQAAQRWAAFALTAIAIPLVSWAFTRYDTSLLKVPRFVQDSAVFMRDDAAFKAEVREALRALKTGQDSIAYRLTQIKCGKLIAEGCR